jgi:hypothetical protein
MAQNPTSLGGYAQPFFEALLVYVVAAVAVGLILFVLGFVLGPIPYDLWIVNAIATCATVAVATNWRRG